MTERVNLALRMGRVSSTFALSMRDNQGAERKTAPAGNRGLTSADMSRQEAVVDIIVPQSSKTGQARATPPAHLSTIPAAVA